YVAERVDGDCLGEAEMRGRGGTAVPTRDVVAVARAREDREHVVRALSNHDTSSRKGGVEVARGVEGHRRERKTCAGSGSLGAGERAAGAGDRVDDPVRADAANAIVVLVADDDVAVKVGGDPREAAEER